MKRFVEKLVYVPILWLVVFFTLIGYATIHLGHLPQNGPDPDPSGMGIGQITFATRLLFIPSVVIWVLWPPVTLIYYIANNPLRKIFLYSDSDIYNLHRR